MLFESNHRALIKDCYPQLSATSPLPVPTSNALGKLTFYASGRPKKIPRVATVLLERAEKDARSSSGHKGRAGLAVTLDIMRGLVTECRLELRCFADQALQLVELGLTRREGQSRDTELEARAASLFHAIATFTTGPFLGLSDALGKQYLRCLALISSLAQLGPDHTSSRAIALAALRGAVTSELLFSQASDYDSQIEEIVPALLFNCVDVPVEELHEKSSVSDATAGTTNLGPISSRKSPTIDPPSTPPTPSSLASEAVHSLRTVSRLSHGVQLTSKLTAMGSWLDRHKGGELWEDKSFIDWLGTSCISASPVQYRASVVGWWVEQVVEIDDTYATPKSETLLHTLSHILRGPTSLVGLGIGGVLAHLTSLVVQRSSLDSEDTLTEPLLATISSLASSHVYYVDQLNDVVSDLIDAVRSVRVGGGVAARLNEEERTRAVRQLVGALGQVLIEAEKGDNEVKVAVPVANGIKASTNGNGTSDQNETVKASSSPSRPPLPDNDGTIRGNGLTLSSNGGQGLRSKKEQTTNGSTPLDALGRPIMRVATAGRRNRVSAEVFQESLFLLLDVDPFVRFEYQRALLVYLDKEMELVPTSPESDQQPVIDPSQEVLRFCQELHTVVYELATSTSLPSLSINNPNEASLQVTSSISSFSGFDNTDDNINTTLPPSRSSSPSSRRRSIVVPSPLASLPSATLSTPNIAQASDYSALLDIVKKLQEKKSSQGVLTGLPMLLALEKAAKKWELEVGVGNGEERIKACEEIVVGGFEATARAWEVEEARRIAERWLEASKPSVLTPFSTTTSPSTEFASTASSQPTPPSKMSSLVDALLSSSTLQSATGSGFANTLNSPWSPDRSNKRSSRIESSTQPSRSVTNLHNTLRVSSTPTNHRASSFRTPSLADLQTSLGQRASSVRGSATPSIASTGAETFATQRRTTKAKAEAVLSRINGRSSSWVEVRLASSSSQLGVH